MTDEMKKKTEKARLYREAYEQGRFDLKMDLLKAIAELVDSSDSGAGVSVKDVLLKIAHVY
ncbi:hypothetical protein KAR91_67110 [Candidatus Pacearchaeota archaeon]|nr:hypothetical protein [Candidatus Pacearchaeota archaeon]